MMLKFSQPSRSRLNQLVLLTMASETFWTLKAIAVMTRNLLEQVSPRPSVLLSITELLLLTATIFFIYSGLISFAGMIVPAAGGATCYRGPFRGPFGGYRRGSR